MCREFLRSRGSNKNKGGGGGGGVILVQILDTLLF